MTGLIQNEQYLVSNKSKEDARSSITEIKYFFLAATKAGRNCFKFEQPDGHEGFSYYKYTLPLPKKKRVNYDFDTFKLGWLIRPLGDRGGKPGALLGKALAIAAHNSGVQTKDHCFTWQYISDELQISKDNGDTWGDGYIEVE